MSDRRSLGQFTDYDGMLNILRARVEELQINGERLDEFAGLPRGYLSKLIGVKPIRKIHMLSMGPLFGALGIYCVIYEDDVTTQRLQKRLVPRNNSYARRTILHDRPITERQWSKIQKLGRKARWQKLSKKQRSQIMHAVSIARFGR
jgi:hypothetical protein